MVCVYLTDITDKVFFGVNVGDFAKERAQYIESIGDECKKVQSTVAWALLQYALKDCFGKKIANAHQKENGRWIIDGFDGCFSITHSKNLVGVAVYSGCVGVDAELFSDKVVALKKRYGLSFNNEDGEREQKKFLLEKFTKEECDYKCQNQAKYYYTNEFVDNEGNEYFFTLAVSKKASVRIEKVLDLDNKDKNIITIGELK